MHYYCEVQKKEIMLTKRKEKTVKYGLAVMGALSVLLGAQVGLLASASGGGTGNPAYDYGWEVGSAVLLTNPPTPGYVIWEECGAHFGYGSSSSNECIYGANQAIFNKGGGGSNK